MSSIKKQRIGYTCEQDKRDEICEIVSHYIDNFLRHTNYSSTFDVRMEVIEKGEDETPDLSIKILVDGGVAMDYVRPLPNPYRK